MRDNPPAPHRQYVQAALAELGDLDAVGCLYHRDPALWTRSPGAQQSIVERFGWLDVVGGFPEWREQLPAFAREVHASGLDHVLLAGMGGSSLAPELFARVFAGQTDGMALTVLDSTHPVAVARALDQADLTTTLVLVSSKSGGTEETGAFAARAAALAPDHRHLAAITDGGSALESQARDEGWRAVWTNRADIGGRYSALSLFGMLPAALLGVDIDRVWASGAAMNTRCGPRAPLAENPAAQLAAFMGGLARAGRDKLTLLLPDALASLGDWVEQLVAESTGKDGVGVVPVVGEPLGSPEVYGQDRAFVVCTLAGEGPQAGALAAAGHPVLTLDLAERHDVGGAFVQWEIATALAGALLGVNPFDEPNVTESKTNTRTALAEAANGALPEPEQGDVAGLIGSLAPGDYLSLQAYLPPGPHYAEPLQRLRELVRDRTTVATTFGWGPRFLHSTGQLHKGGPATVAALQIVDAPTGGPEVPGRHYDFATLVRAQAVGDLRSLRGHRRRVVQCAVDGPDELTHMVETVRTSLGG